MTVRTMAAALLSVNLLCPGIALAGPWADFAEALKSSEELIEDPLTPQDERNRAEGYQQMSRMLRLALWSYVEFGADRGNPTVFLATDPTNLTGGTTSHAVYHQMFPNGTDTYRITGERGTFPLIEFNLTAGRVGLDASATTDAFLTERDLKRRGHKLEVWISPDCDSLSVDNCLQSTPDTSWLIIRQYSARPWKEKSATFHVDNMTTGKGALPSTQGRFSEAEIAERLQTAATFAKGIQAHFKRNMDLIRAIAPINELVFVTQSGGNALPNGHNFSVGQFQIAPDEALVVEFDPPSHPVPPFWNFQIVDYWFRPLDYWSHHESSIADKTVTRERGGSVKLILAHEDPGYCNWLDLKGYEYGNMQFRLSRDLDQPHPDFHTTLVKVADLQASAPAKRRCKRRGPEDYVSPVLKFWD